MVVHEFLIGLNACHDQVIDRDLLESILNDEEYSFFDKSLTFNTVKFIHQIRLRCCALILELRRSIGIFT